MREGRSTHEGGMKGGWEGITGLRGHEGGRP